MISHAVRRVLGPSAAETLRPVNRLRWSAKTRQTLHYHADWRAHPGRLLGYVLWDPEVGDYSYTLLNRDTFAADVARAFDVPPAAVLALFDEAERQPELSDRLEARLRRHPGLPSRPGWGPRLGWYAAVRLRHPRLVVETGVKHGLGSLLLLTALHLNAADEHPGRLISIDENPTAGQLVPDHLRTDWTFVAGQSPDAAAPHPHRYPRRHADPRHPADRRPRSG